jgi:hypothetical protein
VSARSGELQGNRSLAAVWLNGSTPYQTAPFPLIGHGLVLYLLDEVLLGANIDERRVITCRLIQNLLKHRAIEAMSTHDLSLLHFQEFADR